VCVRVCICMHKQTHFHSYTQLWGIFWHWCICTYIQFHTCTPTWSTLKGKRRHMRTDVRSTFTHTHTHSHTIKHTSTHAHIHTHTHSHTIKHTSTHAHTHTHTHTLTHDQTHKYTCTYTHRSTHTHTHSHTIKHTSTHAHIHTDPHIQPHLTSGVVSHASPGAGMATCTFLGPPFFWTCAKGNKETRQFWWLFCHSFWQSTDLGQGDPFNRHKQPVRKGRTGTCIGLAGTKYIQCIYDILGREITKYTVYIYGSGQPYTYSVCYW